VVSSSSLVGEPLGSSWHRHHHPYVQCAQIWKDTVTDETDLEKCNFQNFRSPMTLTLDRVIRHIIMHHSSTSIYIPSFIEIRKKILWTDFFQTPSNVIRLTQRSQPKNEGGGSELQYTNMAGEVLFCSLAVLDSRVGHTMDVLSPFISILCHSD